MPLLVLALLLVVTPPDDTASVVAAALLRVKQADAREPTLTRFQLEHNLILKSNGQRSGESTKLYEQTWINGLPYKMLIERNGKPIAGEELAQEQKRYDQFVAEHKALDEAERARINHGKLLKSTLDFARLQTSAYRITQLRPDQCIGRPCHVYLAQPNHAAPPDPNAKPFTYQLWITDTHPLLTRLTFVLPASSSESGHETTGTLEWDLFNGNPVESHSFFIGFTTDHGHLFEIHTDNVFTRYRRFVTTSTITAVDPSQTPPDDLQ